MFSDEGVRNLHLTEAGGEETDSECESDAESDPGPHHARGASSSQDFSPRVGFRSAAM